MTHTYRFGRVEIDPATRRVLVEGREVPLGGRAFDLLVALAERRDRLVTKDELLAAAWPGLVVEENNLQVQVSTLRRVLGAGAIVTVQGRGYRLGLEAQDDRREEPPLGHNLPSAMASFVGRERELSDLAQSLARHRLVTLTGTGGIGKTALALRVGADALADHADGVWFTDLARISDPLQVAEAAAAALGAAESPGMTAIDRVTRHARPKRLLLILDNCEHLRQASAELAEAVLRAAPGAKVLATSREPLRLAGEVVFAVSSLDEDAAVRLFVDRASGARAGFAVTSSNADAVSSICRDLDGIPLAIELAAARVRTMPLAAIAERLGDRFRLLTSGAATAMPRQQTLRAAIDWSYELLSREERALLRRLCVFAGGLALEAAEAVGAGGEIAEGDVLDLLSRVVDKSLVVPNDADGRYRMLETVRQYAQERLAESRDESDARLAHMRFYAARASVAADEANGPRQPHWQAWFATERENLRLALAHSRSVAGGASAGLAIVGMLRWVPITGHEVWYRACGEALAHPEGQGASLERCRALTASGFLAYVVGDYEVARAWSEENVRMADLAGDAQAKSEAHWQLASALLENEPGLALVHCRTSYEIAHAAGDQRLVAHAATAMGEVHAAAGRFDLALPFYMEAFERGRGRIGAGDVAVFLLNLVMCEVMLDMPAAAIEHLREAIPLGDMRRSARHAHAVLVSCAAVAVQRAAWFAAARLFGAVEGSATRHGLAEEPSGQAMLERSMTHLRAALDPATLESALRAGRALDEHAALAEALAWLEGMP